MIELIVSICSLLHTITVVCFMLINTLTPRYNGRHFADDILKCIFLNENAWILINISLKSIHKGQINNIPALVQIMPWRRPGDKPLSEPMMYSLLTDIYAPLSLNGWTRWGFVAVTHICINAVGHHYCRQRLAAWPVPSHYLNQCWLLPIGPIETNFVWNWD